MYVWDPHLIKDKEFTSSVLGLQHNDEMLDMEICSNTSIRGAKILDEAWAIV